MGLFTPNIAKLKTKKDAGGLVKALRDKDQRIRAEAAKALGELGDARAVEPLVATLADPDLEVRGRAILALALVGDARAVEPLTRALNDAKTDVRDKAAIALGKVMERKGPEVRPVATGAFVKLGPERLEELLTRKDDRYNYHLIHLTAVAALKHTGGESTAGVLVRALDHRAVSYGAQGSAAAALGEMGSPALEPLIAVLEDATKSKDMREAATRALGKIGDPRAAEPLVAALGDQKGDVRRGAVMALRTMGDLRAAEPLTREIDVEIKNLFSSPALDTRKTREALLLFAPVSALSADIVEWAVKAAGFGTEWGGGFDHNKQYLDLRDSDVAIGHLCDLDSPVTSNLLHLIARKKDITVSLALCAYSRDEKASFQAQGDRAAAELERRGTPPYLPEAYVTLRQETA